MTDLGKAALILIVIGGAVYFVTRTSKRAVSPWAKTGSPQTGPASVSSGVGWQPAFTETAAEPTDSVVTGEPETGNILSAAACGASAKVTKPFQGWRYTKPPSHPKKG